MKRAPAGGESAAQRVRETFARLADYTSGALVDAIPAPFLRMLGELDADALEERRATSAVIVSQHGDAIIGMLRGHWVAAFLNVVLGLVAHDEKTTPEERAPFRELACMYKCALAVVNRDPMRLIEARAGLRAAAQRVAETCAAPALLRNVLPAALPLRDALRAGVSIAIDHMDDAAQRALLDHVLAAWESAAAGVDVGVRDARLIAHCFNAAAHIAPERAHRLVRAVHKTFLPYGQPKFCYLVIALALTLYRAVPPHEAIEAERDRIAAGIASYVGFQGTNQHQYLSSMWDNLRHGGVDGLMWHTMSIVMVYAVARCLLRRAHRVDGVHISTRPATTAHVLRMNSPLRYSGVARGLDAADQCEIGKVAAHVHTAVQDDSTRDEKLWRVCLAAHPIPVEKADALASFAVHARTIVCAARCAALLTRYLKALGERACARVLAEQGITAPTLRVLRFAPHDCTVQFGDEKPYVDYGVDCAMLAKSVLFVSFSDRAHTEAFASAERSTYCLARAATDARVRRSMAHTRCMRILTALRCIDLAADAPDPYLDVLCAGDTHALRRLDGSIDVLRAVRAVLDGVTPAESRAATVADVLDAARECECDIAALAALLVGESCDVALPTQPAAWRAAARRTLTTANVISLTSMDKYAAMPLLGRSMRTIVCAARIQKPINPYITLRSSCNLDVFGLLEPPVFFENMADSVLAIASHRDLKRLLKWLWHAVVDERGTSVALALARVQPPSQDNLMMALIFTSMLYTGRAVNDRIVGKLPRLAVIVTCAPDLAFVARSARVEEAFCAVFQARWDDSLPKHRVPVVLKDGRTVYMDTSQGGREPAARDMLVYPPHMFSYDGSRDGGVSVVREVYLLSVILLLLHLLVGRGPLPAWRSAVPYNGYHPDSAIMKAFYCTVREYSGRGSLCGLRVGSVPPLPPDAPPELRMAARAVQRLDWLLVSRVK